MSPEPAASEHAGDAEHILALLAEPARLRVFAAVALGAARVVDIASSTSLDVRTVERGLARLVAGGIVVSERGVHRVATEEILSIARAAAHRRSAEGETLDGDNVLGRFMRAGRLHTIPSSRSKRLVVLDHLAQRFEPGRRYPEREVNAMLAAVHEDVASLRRYLVDEGFLSRESGYYWRSGGEYFPE